MLNLIYAGTSHVHSTISLYILYYIKRMISVITMTRHSQLGLQNRLLIKTFS